jgi:opacity protein-like surface antigen
MRQLCRRLCSYTVFAVCVSGSAAAADPLGFYIGGAIGQAHVAANVPDPFLSTSDSFTANHSAFKLMVGMRPIPLLGAELSYMDFGHPSSSLFGYSANTSMRGSSVFGILYVPIPMVDVYAKAGVARIQSSVSGIAPNGDNLCVLGMPCGTSPLHLDRTNTGLAAGAGAQLKFGPWAARAEYERFNATGDNPYLLTLGLTWSFF